MHSIFEKMLPKTNNFSLFALMAFSTTKAMAIGACAAEERPIFQCEAIKSREIKSITLCGKWDEQKQLRFLRLAKQTASGHQVEIAKTSLPSNEGSASYYYNAFPKGFISAIAFPGKADSRISLFNTLSRTGFNGAGLAVNTHGSATLVAECKNKTITLDKDMSYVGAYFDLSKIGLPDIPSSVDYIDWDGNLTSNF